MLVREQGKRAYTRTGLPDTPSRRSDEDSKYGVLPSEIDHPEVWESWHEGYGLAYRREGENRYHWSEGFDARSPRQLVHAQNPITVRGTYSIPGSYETMFESIDEIVDSSLLIRGGPSGTGRVALIGNNGWVVGYPTATNFIIDFVAQWGGGGSPRFLHPAVTFGSYMFFGSTGGTTFMSMASNGANGIYGSLPAYRYALAGNILWRAHGPSEKQAYYLQNCADAAGGAGSAPMWGPTYNLGNYQGAIKDMVALEDQVFAGVDTGLYAGDQTGTFVNVLADLGKQVHPDNCRDLTLWSNSVVAQHAAGVFRYLPGGNVEEISPPRAGRSPISGMVRALRGYGRYLYAGLYTGSQSWLLCGERQQRGVAWHPLQRLPHNTKISRIHIDGITTATSGTKIPNRIWIATESSIDTSGTAPVYVWPIPTLDGNPLAPGGAFSANYIGSARMDLGSIDNGAPSTPKVFRSFEVWADMLFSGYRYCDVYYDLDQSGSFALLGRAQTSPKTTLYHSSGEGSYVTGQSIEYSVRSFTASPAFTPVYRTFVARSSLRPNSVDEIIAVVRIADNMRDRQNGEMRSAATMITELRALAKQGTPTTLIDLSGAVNYVNVLPPINEVEIYQLGEQEPEVAATIRMSVLTYS